MESPECPKAEILWPLDNRPKEGLSIVPAVITSVGAVLTNGKLSARVYIHLSFNYQPRIYPFTHRFSKIEEPSSV
jgi:hypothetical protein